MIITNPTTEQLHKLEKFISEHPNGNFFQSPSYYIFYKSLPNYEPVILISMDSNENITGSLIAVIQKEKGYLKSKLSSRCIVFGGPIVNNNSSDVADNLLKELTKLVQCKSIYIEFRNLFDVSALKSVYTNNGFQFENRINFVIEIESVEENRKKLNENRRRQIIKSVKRGTIIVEAESFEQVKAFYTILKVLYTTRVKKPLPDFDFFQGFFEQKNLGKYLLIEYEGKIIGGIMCPNYKATIYEWYVCGLDTEYREQSPSVMATWAAIEYAAKNHFKYFDFMGAGKPDDAYGVREFKSKFGGKEVTYGRYIRINNSLLYKIGKTGLKLLQKLK